jgi:hypothetical protein
MLFEVDANRSLVIKGRGQEFLEPSLYCRLADCVSGFRTVPVAMLDARAPFEEYRRSDQ